MSAPLAVIGAPAAARTVVTALAYVGLLTVLVIVGLGLLVLIDDVRANRRRRARQETRRAEEARLQEAERQARIAARAERLDADRARALADAEDRIGIVVIVPDVAGAIDKATAYRDVAALQPYEQKDFR